MDDVDVLMAAAVVVAAVVLGGVLPDDEDMAVLLAAVLAEALDAAEPVRVPKSRDWFDNVVPLYSPEEYRKHFRFEPAFVAFVHDRICDHAVFTVSLYKQRVAMTVWMQLHIALYRLSRPTTVNDVAAKFGVSVGSVLNADARVQRAIVNCLFDDAVSRRFPTTEAQRKAAALAWRLDSSNKFQHCLGALDATQLPITVPPGHLSEWFFSGHTRYPSIALQVVADSHKRIISYAVGQPGVANDKLVFSTSLLGRFIQRFVPAPYYLLCDGGYSLRPPHINPYSPATASAAEREFNLVLSSKRIKVENAFGLFKCRFRIWLYKGGYARSCINDYALAAKVCVILHNLAIDWRLCTGLFEGDADDAEDEEDVGEEDDDAFSDASSPSVAGYSLFSSDSDSDGDEDMESDDDDEDGAAAGVPYDLASGRERRKQIRMAMGIDFKNPGE